MKMIFRLLKWTAIVLIGVPVLIYLVWLTGNLTNDGIAPELSSLLARRNPQLNEKDNAYFDTIGLAASANVEPHAWGVSLFAQASANDKATNDGKSPTPINMEGYPPTFKGVSKQFHLGGRNEVRAGNANVTVGASPDHETHIHVQVKE